MRRRSFRDDDGSIQWRSVRQHLRSRCWVAWSRAHNRILDARAVLAGACNASTWDPALGNYAGGYNHWRCGKRRGHLRDRSIETETGRNGPHRFINYTWDGPGQLGTDYAPLPLRNAENTDWFDSRSVIPFNKLTKKRHPVDSRRRSRQRAARQSKLMAEYRSLAEED